jgi:hypothetical protein
MAAHLNEWCGDHTKPAHPFLDTQQNEALREPVQPCGLRGRREDQIIRYECREYDPKRRTLWNRSREGLISTYLPKKVKAGTASADIFSAVAKNMAVLGIGTSLVRRDYKRAPEATSSPPGRSKSEHVQYMSGSMKLGYRLLKGNISINTTKRTVRSRSKRKM